MTKRSSPKATSRGGSSRQPAPRMAQPESMKTRAYFYGVDKLNGYDAWALFKASAAGDASKVAALLAKDRRLANAQCWYQFPIHLAVWAGHADIVKLLLAAGADPGQSRFTYRSWDKLLRVATERGYHKVATLLTRAMQKKFNYSPEFSALKNAIIARNPRNVDAILRQSPKLAQTSDELGNNAIHWSVITRQLSLLGRFADAGTPIDACRADGQTPLLLAASEAYDYWYRGARGRRHPSLRNAWVMVGDLLARGAKYTISVAAAVGDYERVEQLLKKKPELAQQLDSARVSALSYAAREGYVHIVELLLKHGAAPNRPEELAPDGRALFEACGGNHYEVAELLLKHGANPNAGVDSSGCCLTIVGYHHPGRCKRLQELLRRHGAHTPPYELGVQQMKQALRDGHKVIRDEEFLGNLLSKNNRELLELFLEADPTVPDRLQVYAGVTYPKSPALIRVLLERGLDVNRPDWLGKTFLHACAENGDRAAARVFLDARADINARDIEHHATPLASDVRHEPWCRQEDRSKLAARKKRMVQFLLKRGAATNLPDNPPWATPLAWARRLGLTEIEAILIEHGAE